MAVEGQPLRSRQGFHVRAWSGAYEPPTQPPTLRGRPLGPCQVSHVPPTNLGVPPGKVKWGPQRPLLNSVQVAWKQVWKWGPEDLATEGRVHTCQEDLLPTGLGCVSGRVTEMPREVGRGKGPWGGASRGFRGDSILSAIRSPGVAASGQGGSSAWSPFSDPGRASAVRGHQPDIFH